MSENFQEIALSLAEIGRNFYARGWALGTSGNFSAAVNRDPLRLAMSPSGVDKGQLRAEQILLIDEGSNILSDHPGKPSDESPLHIRVVMERGAGAVLHTHSIWSTILSDLYAAEGGLTIEGYEMLKGLEGIKTHEHRAWLPVIENSQDMTALSENVSELVKDNGDAHGFLLRRHGLYTWGQDLAQAKRHVEILEFLLEAMSRTRLMLEGSSRGV
jgi:methylthioribulose-1-phosphate dehydratase